MKMMIPSRISRKQSDMVIPGTAPPGMVISVVVMARPAVQAKDSSGGLSKDEKEVHRNIPQLPDEGIKVGAFVCTAMENLAAAGCEFSDEQMRQLLGASSMHDNVGLSRNLPFSSCMRKTNRKAIILMAACDITRSHWLSVCTWSI